ncbi:MAG: hypothetical protein AB1351_09025 [Thermoproteota archaeon]
MVEIQDDAHFVHFAHYASKLEKHLRTNGISCHDADVIIEESSAYYFEKLHSQEIRFIKLVRRHDSAELFAESAARAIQMHFPEAKNTFGSYNEIAKCIR